MLQELEVSRVGSICFDEVGSDVGEELQIVEWDV
jgi:hypothetical protein